MVNAPSLRPGLDLYFRGFYELSTCRTYGFAEGPIPWTAAWVYATERLGLDRVESIRFVQFVFSLDSAYLKHQAEKSKRERKSVDGKGSTRSRKIGR